MTRSNGNDPPRVGLVCSICGTVIPKAGEHTWEHCARVLQSKNEGRGSLGEQAQLVSDLLRELLARIRPLADAHGTSLQQLLYDSIDPAGTLRCLLIAVRDTLRPLQASTLHPRRKAASHE